MTAANLDANARAALLLAMSDPAECERLISALETIRPIAPADRAQIDVTIAAMRELQATLFPVDDAGPIQ